MWKMTAYTKTGERNRKNGLLCQDCVCDMKNREEGISVITLADGTGTDDLARIGAERSAKTLAEILSSSGNFQQFFEMDKELVQYNVITTIQSSLYDLCEEYDVGLERLHSTLMGIAVDEKNGRFIVIHLGDGCVGMRNKEKFMVMSFPENGCNRSETYLTSQHKVGKHVRVIRNQIKDIREFILLSDGWNEKVSASSHLIQTEMLRNAEKNLYADDVSFIALKCQE